MTYDFSVWFYAFPYMLAGAVTTLEISALAMVAGSVIGLLCGLLSQSGLAPVRWTIRGYVYFVRGTPALVQIFLIYFALPVIVGDEVVAAIDLKADRQARKLLIQKWTWIVGERAGLKGMIDEELARFERFQLA